MSLCLFNTRLVHPSEISYSSLSGISPRPDWWVGAPLALPFSPRADTFLRAARPRARLCDDVLAPPHTRPKFLPYCPYLSASIAMPRPVFLFVQPVSRKVQIFVTLPTDSAEEP